MHDVDVLIRRSSFRLRAAKRCNVVVPAVMADSDQAQASFRYAVYRAIVAAHKIEVASVGLEIRGCTTQVPMRLAAKLISQEIFRFLQNFQITTVKKIIITVPRAWSAIVESTVKGYLSYLRTKICLGPFLTVDGIVEFQKGIVLVERKNPPLGWALPGGFVDRGETVEHAVVREIKEETNLTFAKIKNFKICSDPKRDQRFHTVSVVFMGIGKGHLRAASDANDARVFLLNALPKHIAFDHKEIIKEFVRLKQKRT